MSSGFKTLTGFIGGVAVTASISHLLLWGERNLPQSSVPFASQTLYIVEGNRERFPFGMPDDMRKVIHRNGYTLCYDPAKKQPLWVAQLLTSESYEGNADRGKCKWRRDDKVPEGFTADNSDFKDTHWTKGHMAAASDYKCSQADTNDTFFLSNAVPHHGKNNRQFWSRLEQLCQNLTSKYAKVLVTTGPVYKINHFENSPDKKKISYIKHQVIGDNKVAVPTHLFKAVVAYNSLDGHEKPAVGVFVVPNEKIGLNDADLAKYKVKLEELENLTGFTFYPSLPRDGIAELCEDSSELIISKKANKRPSAVFSEDNEALPHPTKQRELRKR